MLEIVFDNTWVLNDMVDDVLMITLEKQCLHGVQTDHDSDLIVTALESLSKHCEQLEYDQLMLVFLKRVKEVRINKEVIQQRDPFPLQLRIAQNGKEISLEPWPRNDGSHVISHLVSELDHDFQETAAVHEILDIDELHDVLHEFRRCLEFVEFEQCAALAHLQQLLNTHYHVWEVIRAKGLSDHEGFS